MDEERLQAYLNLIQQLLTCPSGEEIQIIESNRELVDAELLQVMAQEAEKLAADGNQNAAEFLGSLRSDLLERISESPTLVNASDQDYLEFFKEVLLATSESNSDPKVVYPLLEANLDKLDHNFIDILQTWASSKLSEAEPKIAKIMATVIGEFSNFISDFTLGKKANNMEIAIAGYETILTVFTNQSKPENLANLHHNLGIAYINRINGDKADNLELAIEAYQLALSVWTKPDFPENWAITQYNLGIAYRNRINGDKADNLELAIEAYQLALSVRTKPDFPEDWANTQYNLGIAYSNRINGDKADNLELAIEAYQLALSVRTKPDFPENWANTQNNLGIAYIYRIRGDKADNLEHAIEAYQLALSVLTKPDFPENWANTQYNLGYAYGNRIRGNRPDNLELAIEAFQLALEVITKQDFPEDWAIVQNNLGNVYSKRILGNSAENLKNAIASYQNASEIYTREAFPEDWADVQTNIGKLLVQRGSWYDGLSRLEQSLAIYRQTENLEARADAIYHIARTHHLMMNLDKARIHYRDALRIYDYIKNQEGIAACKTGLGRLMISLGFIDDARQELTQACDIYHKLKDNQKIDNIQEIFQLLAKSKINKLKKLNPSHSHE
ncbi:MULTISPECIES: tetratricopeptide repeat protein [unclassified Moorena]|uniref:tetratricopeptide repeat protein n=1 Tax=unclassified Moorena TaxID=2683338 RepID=UPI0013B74C76|nr:MULTISPECIES: tetratricopeptide repeat protein [unclassified Moorena]NEP36340.1 tetratricopeptide repeat protein [Moorena sp. SIO3B2]NER91217.1 tetratricopeptide repeat protein [Moorena sp. SIO3A2]